MDAKNTVIGSVHTELRVEKKKKNGPTAVDKKISEQIFKMILNIIKFVRNTFL